MNEAEADALIARHRYSERDVERILREGYENHQAFCARLKIRDKQGVLRVPDWSPSWAKVARAVDGQQRKGRPVRGIILKGRQEHFTAGICTHLFKRCAFLPGQHGRVFSDKHVNAANAYRYLADYTDHYEPRGTLKTLGQVRKRNEEKLAWPEGSWVEFGSAENATGGRSASVRHALLDEFAFWRDAETLMTGMLNSVPDDPDTLVLIPSTANGAGGPFFDRWQTYSDPGYSGEWFALFNAWWEHPENSMRVSDSRRFQDSLTREELEIGAQYALTLEQLYWRRWAIKNKCEGSIQKFHQEHPASAEEAFLTSGRPRFCHVSLGRMAQSRDAAVGHLERIRTGTTERLAFIAHEDGRGDLRVFKRPAAGRKYVIGADAAEGIDVKEGLGTDDPDYSDFYVCDQDTGEQVACFHARLEPDPSGEAICALAEWYGWAFLVPEVNSVGLAFVQAILYRNYPVHLIYHRERDPDDRRPAMLQELGWKETPITRQQLISTHDRMIRELAINIACPHCQGQHRTFVVKATGRAEHQEGCHDDAVFAGALASIGLQVAPRIRALMEARKPKPVDWDRDDEDDGPGNRRGRAGQYRIRR